MLILILIVGILILFGGEILGGKLGISGFGAAIIILAVLSVIGWIFEG